MKRSLLKIVAPACGLAAALAAVARPVAAQEQASLPPTRIVAGISSAQEAMASVEHVVVKLADKKRTWDNTIKDSIEIFLIGVALDKPIRFDPMFDPEHGMQTQTIIPLADLKEFLEENIEPIGIENKRAAPNDYELTGDVYQGWLRNFTEPTPYAIMFPQRPGLPAKLEEIVAQHADLVKDVPLAFVHMKNAAEGVENRKTAFAKYQDKMMADVEKLSTETQDQFALRRKLREQNYAMLRQWFVESKEVLVSTKVDRTKNTMPAQLKIEALPDTGLFKDIEQLKDRSSLFAAVPSPENAVLSGRINMPIDPERHVGYIEMYKLARPVIEKKIDDDQQSSAAEKAAQKTAANLFLDILSSADKTPMLDGMVDVYPHNGKHTLMFAVECPDQAKLQGIIDQLEHVVEEWKLEKDVDKVGEVAIHKLNLGERVPKALVEFYGDSKAVYMAAAPNIFWLASGEGSLPALKERMEIVAKGEAVPPSGLLISARMNVHPVLKNVHETRQQVNLQFLKSLNLFAQQPAAAEDDEKKPAQGVRPGGARGANLATFKWQETAIEALAGTNDKIELTLKRTAPGTLNGEGMTYEGMLKALGAVIAKFSEETLN